MAGIADSFRINGSALNAQSQNLNMIARNMANAQVVSGSEAGAYRARLPVFAEVLDRSMAGSGAATGVRLEGFSESQAPIERQSMPEHPLADENGYIYLSNVNVVAEMANMMQASRTYQSNIEVINTSKQLMLRTLNIGK